MPRRPRVFVAGASYHVYCRVARGERVFADPREAAALVGVIREVVREHGLSVLAWCVMPTHDHLAGMGSGLRCCVVLAQALADEGLQAAP